MSEWLILSVGLATVAGAWTTAAAVIEPWREVCVTLTRYVPCATGGTVVATMLCPTSMVYLLVALVGVQLALTAYLFYRVFRGG